MWRYARPKFESLLLAELQRQQRCSQYCDTLLRAGGVAVPAHSCILSALCPQLSCVLSSPPPSSPGQSHLIDFQAFGACALLRLVGLLYSGEMVVEGEMEREEVMAAAAKLGINGLVEVGWSGAEDGARSGERYRRAGPSSTEGGRWKERVREVGVQTEPLDNLDDHVARSGERETPAGFKADADIQTCAAIMDISHQPLCLQSLEVAGPAEEHCQISTIYSSSSTHPGPLVSYRGDLTALQEVKALPPGSVGAVDLPPRIPCIPLSLLCPLDGQQPSDLSSMLTTWGEPAEATQVYVNPPSFSSSSSLIPSSTPSVYMSGRGMEAFPPSAPGPHLAVDLLEAECEEYEQFRGNIPGFISYFLNPANFGEGERGDRRGRRRRVGVGAKRGVEKRRARKPRGRRGEGGNWVETAAAPKEQVTAEVPQGNWLRRLWAGALRVGRGGGMVGRKVYLKTRDMLQPIKMLLRRKKRRGRRDVWEVSRPGMEKSQAPRGKPRRTKTQMKQDGISIIKRQVGRPRSRPLPFPPLPKYLFEALTYDPTPGPLDSTPPTAAFLTPEPTPASTANPISPSPVRILAPASTLLHTDPLPPLSPQEDSAERFECLLQDIMKDLDVIPKAVVVAQPNNHPQESPAIAQSNRDHSSEDSNQQLTLSGLSTGYHGDINAITPTAYPVAEATAYGFECEVPVLQEQQTEGDLSDILDHFLLSFEQLVASSANSVLKGNMRTDCSHTDGAPEPYAQTRQAEHRAQTNSASELTHTVSSPHGARHTHSQYGAEPDPQPHTAPKPPSFATLSPAKTAPSTGQPSHFPTEEKPVEEGRRMTRSQIREGIRTSDTRGVKRFPPAWEHESPPSQTQPTKPPPTQSQPTKPPPSQSQLPKPTPSQSQPTEPPSQSQLAKPLHSQSQPTKVPPSQTLSIRLINSQPAVRIKPLSVDQLKSPCSSKQVRDKTNHLARKIKPSLSVCAGVQQLERYATVCVVKLDDAHLRGKRPLPSKQPMKVPEKVSVQMVQPIREIEDLNVGVREEQRRFIRRSVARFTSNPSPGTTQNRGENGGENGGEHRGENRAENRGEKRLRLEPETNKPKKRKEEDDRAKREATCPGFSEPVKSNSVSQGRMSSPELQLPVQRHRSPAQNRDESGKKGPVTREFDKEVDVIHVTAATRFEEVMEVLCSESGGADMERVCGSSEGGEEEKREENNWVVCRRQETPSSEEDIDVVELDSIGSVDIVGEGDGEQVEGGGGAGQQRRLGVERTPGLVHCGKDPMSVSLFTHEHSKTSTGSSEEEEEVDVVGDYSSVPLVALPGIWGEGLCCEDEEEEDVEEEIDVTG